MTVIADDLLPHATDALLKVAEAEVAKADERKRAAAAAEAEKRALIEQLQKPSGISEEEGIRRAAAIIKRAVSNGLTEVQVYRFPNALCTDHGRAINQGEPGWENTLTGLPKEMFQLWQTHLKPRGYKLRYQIVDFPGGMPGDIAITLSWR
jgi:hypothetical protein